MEQEFIWRTEHEHGDNMVTMYDFLENYLEEVFNDDVEILEHDGTYAEILYEGTKYGLHASGNGDFFNHKITIEKIIE